ncbi:putative serine/threonine-protein kinase PBL22 isoform X2 [Apium graveolens]|uniref:putative serine/threonine-protein kinase PBL22 isoform X2 n=1 Tax=Apium graveolens TaxID=4045 RepID=UPI003D7B90F7
MFSLLRSKTVKKRMIVIGLKDDNSSREVLLRLLNMVVMVGDSVLAVHVQELDGCEFDPNTFHIHEDLCKSKQVEFQVKVCTGSSYMVALSHQVRTYFATILALGCSNFLPDDSKVSRCLKTLPPTCTLLVLDSSGRILIQMAGTSQQGSSSTKKVLRSSLSTPSKSTLPNQSARRVLQVKKSVSMPVSSASPSNYQTGNSENSKMQSRMSQKVFQRLATLDIRGSGRRFSAEQLKYATNNFDPGFLIGEGGHSKVYRAKFEKGQAVAVKVLKAVKNSSEDFFFREVEILSSLNHENIVRLIGYCYSQEMQAVVCNLLECSLKRRLNQLEWSDRMRVSIHVAKALDYLHSFSPPIIHRDVKSSNILLSDDCQPQLSDFGAATVHQQTQKPSIRQRPFDVVGTFGYMAPEYMMYGRIDEKIDVYSYGVVLLELITGKAAIQTNQESQHESLVLWAKSLLDSSLCECLIDPFLDEDYDKDEMATMMTVARLCLLDQSSSRPTMKILQLFEEPQQWLEMQIKKEGLFGGISLNGDTESSHSDETDST